MPDQFTIYEHKNFTGQKCTVILDDKTSGQLYSLKTSGLHDKMSSIQWSLSGNRKVTFYEHSDSTGRTYTIKGSGSDADTHENNFKDMASCWRLFGSSSIPLAFYKIPTQALSVKFTLNGKTLPSGGHLQGIQQLDHEHLVISGSSDKKAFFFLARWTGGIKPGKTGEIISLMAIDGYDHAGGIQLIDKTLVLGLENEGDSKNSSVAFFDLTDTARPREIGKRIIRDWDTAGAVGILKIPSRFLLIVGGNDSDRVDFYQSNNLSINSDSCVFTLFKTWKKTNKDSANWIDENWGIYQSLNLLQEQNGTIYLLAFNRYSHFTNDSGLGSEDWVDLYSVNLKANESRIFVKIDKKHVYCCDGASFRWGGGLFAPDPDSKITLLAVEKTIHEYTAVNIF